LLKTTKSTFFMLFNQLGEFLQKKVSLF